MEKSLPSEYTKRLDRLVIKAREVMFNARSPSIIERLYIKAKDIGSEVSEISEEGSLLAAGYFLDRVGRYFGQGESSLRKYMQKDIFRLEYNLNILPSNKSRDADFDEILYNLNRLSDKISVDDGSRREVRAARDKDGVYSVERFAEENPVEKGSNIDAEAMLKRARRPKISPEEADEWVKKQGRRAGKRRYLTGAEPRRK